MSSREPLWFCHECHAEMRPLMVPDPICASCRGSFVEKIEDSSNDPREFSRSDAADFEADGMPPGMDTFLMTLQSLMDRGIADGNRPPRTGAEIGSGGNRHTFQIRASSGQRSNSIGSRVGGTGSRGGVESASRPGGVPTVSEFLRGGSDNAGGPTITGPIMAQYLMALLGHRGPMDPLFGTGMGGIEEGRMGDYVFNQEALDHIITQLMENSNSHRPVPATEDIISNLPREVLELGSSTLEKDCAVCKDQFKLETDDPDEQVVITLPCKHPFHEPCILPWLKSSGTCPVCRHALIPQPEHHPAPGSGGPSGRSTSPFSQQPRAPDRAPQDPSGLFQSLFGGLVGSRTGNQSADTSSGHRRSNSDHTSNRGNAGNSNIPGGWNDDLD
ncbi:hypothetical protein BDZ94DRAFT_1243324 [Collybia nuda]|uniref:RING-type domain-containing protein n=1 Tax=Collybia nuda TaxID=64659 RepID=A0A9P5YJK8_9AGAR|nr:hypothetical protein BDZ94DRAFT_1243324 [Collybia nuda]